MISARRFVMCGNKEKGCGKKMLPRGRCCLTKVFNRLNMVGHTFLFSFNPDGLTGCGGFEPPITGLEAVVLPDYTNNLRGS